MIKESVQRLCVRVCVCVFHRGSQSCATGPSDTQLRHSLLVNVSQDFSLSLSSTGKVCTKEEEVGIERSVVAAR